MILHEPEVAVSVIGALVRKLGGDVELSCVEVAEIGQLACEVTTEADGTVSLRLIVFKPELAS